MSKGSPRASGSPSTCIVSPRPAPVAVGKISARNKVPKGHGMRFVESFKADVTARYAAICSALDRVRDDDLNDDIVATQIRNVRSHRDQLKYHFANILDLLSLSESCSVHVRMMFIEMTIEKIKRKEIPSYQEVLELIKFTRILMSLSQDPEDDKVLEKYLKILTRILSEMRGRPASFGTVAKLDLPKSPKSPRKKEPQSPQRPNEPPRKEPLPPEARVRTVASRKESRGGGLNPILGPIQVQQKAKQNAKQKLEEMKNQQNSPSQGNLAGIKLGKPVRKKDLEWEYSDDDEQNSDQQKSSPNSPRVQMKTPPKKNKKSENAWVVVSSDTVTIESKTKVDAESMVDIKPVLGFSGHSTADIDCSYSDISWLNAKTGSVERVEAASGTRDVNEAYEAEVRERVTDEVRKEFEERSREFEENLKKQYEEMSGIDSSVSGIDTSGFSMAAEEIDIAPNKKDIAKDICREMMKAAQKIRRQHELANDLAELEGLEGLPPLRLSDVDEGDVPLTLSGRISRGMKLFDPMNPQDKAKILELAKLFTEWAESYDASQKVWEVMKEDQSFELDVLLSQIPVTFADFLVEAIKTFSFEESLDVSESLPPDDTLFY